MKYRTLSNCLQICYDSNITAHIWGHTGVGKSSIVRQFCDKNHLGFIDFRLSQIEASDLRGLPDRDKENGHTIYRPPEDLPVGDYPWEAYEALIKENKNSPRLGQLAKTFQRKLARGILFLDELPRAADDVQQAVFQLVLDRAIGNYVIPPGWGIICAGNFLEGYIQTGFTDPAFTSRFSHLTLSAGEQTMMEWVDYMIETHGDKSAEVIEFVGNNYNLLDGDRKGELGFPILPSRRAWDMVQRVRDLNEEKHYDTDAVNEVVAGLVGLDAQNAFGRFKMPVKPQQIIDQGIEPLRGVLTPVAKNRGMLVSLMLGLLVICKPKAEDEKYCNRALDFVEWMASNSAERDLIVAFCRGMSSKGDVPEADIVRAAALSNPSVAEIIARVRAKHPQKQKSFIDRLNERPNLQVKLKDISWGTDE